MPLTLEQIIKIRQKDAAQSDALKRLRVRGVGCGPFGQQPYYLVAGYEAPTHGEVVYARALEDLAARFPGESLVTIAC